MANHFGPKLQQQTLSNLAGVRHACLPAKFASVSSFCFRTPLPGLLKRRRGNVGFGFSRRVVLGLGVSFWSQFMSMAGTFGGKTFLASARQKGMIEEVIYRSYIVGYLNSCFSFFRPFGGMI